ncbi:recombinase family protein [Streptomyces sp. 4F14]|uniref:recombinase family protein n=1 Tax=Streptomyces sp. 4F14 TaxID=3394380 RepID=UPI003A89D156
MPTVCARNPERLEEARLFVEERDWRLGRVFADDYGWSTCAARPAWGAVRREIGSGRADGVVVPTLSVISSHLGEVAEQLGWFEAHSAFIAVTEAGGVVSPGEYLTEQDLLSLRRLQYRATPSPRDAAEWLDACQGLASVEWARYPLAGVLAVLELASRAGERGERGPVAPVVSVDTDGALTVSMSGSRLGTPPPREACVPEAAAVWLRELGGEIVCHPQPDGAGDTVSVRLPRLPADHPSLAVTSVSVSAEEA